MRYKKFRKNSGFRIASLKCHNHNVVLKTLKTIYKPKLKFFCIANHRIVSETSRRSWTKKNQWIQLYKLEDYRVCVYFWSRIKGVKRTKTLSFMWERFLLYLHYKGLKTLTSNRMKFFHCRRFFLIISKACQLLVECKISKDSWRV